ncbi:MAG TPA: hypothetical protein VKQ11_17675 [Candidatus Sulfotelmatobacter sp.]|nr:hypothetical protein [Candidatus Sulfotelmatobacter sp.]
MRRLSALLSFLLLAYLANAQNRPEPIRLCVSTLQNSSHSALDTTWQRNQLMKMFERINKGKDVTKGKAARIGTVLLESNSETDPAVRDNNCQFILHTNVLEIIDSGTSDAGSSRPRPVEIGSARDDPRADSADDNRATIAYRIMRAGELEPWSSDILTAHDPLPDAMVISHLMDQIANRVADKLRERR